MNGFLLIDKPKGPSSMDAVRRIKKIFHAKRAGHSGTLDPYASGLLLVAVGSATRLFSFLPSEPKTYRFDIVFGTSTDTMDSEGKIIESSGIIPAKPAVISVLEEFEGEIKQIPPKFSALKINGKRAYARARRNEEFEIPERSVRIYSLKLLEFDSEHQRAQTEVVCSGGTYVRSLARDIALKLGTVAHASQIRRLSIGEFTLEKAVELNAPEERIRNSLHAPHEFLRNFPSYRATREQQLELSHGKDITISGKDSMERRLFIYNHTDELIAVAQNSENGKYHPVKVFEGV